MKKRRLLGLGLALVLLLCSCVKIEGMSPSPFAAGGTSGSGTGTTTGATGGSNTGSASGTTTGTTGEGFCAPLPAPTGNVIHVTPSQASQLQSIVAQAQNGDTISLADGTYPLGNQYLSFQTPGVTLRSDSGNREAVILDGQYQAPEIKIAASNVTVSSITIKRLVYHPIHVVPKGGDTLNTLIDNVHLIDPGEQGIKINTDGSNHWTDNGEVRCSTIELTDAGRAHIESWDPSQGLSCYTGGIDGHDARGWRIRDNVIRNFWCSSGLSEHAINFWTQSRDTISERNLLINNARGIGYGLRGTGTATRTYSDNPCPGVSGYVDHYGGIIRNNFLLANDSRLFNSEAGFDSGIDLDSSCFTKTVHNTVVSTAAPVSSSIEYRFTTTMGGEILNNLMTHNLLNRQAGTGITVAGNVQNAGLSDFVDAANGDLHLVSTASGALKKGVAVSDGSCPDDIDGDARSSPPDAGADQHLP